MPITWTDKPEANQLLDSDPLALMIGLVLDQQVKMEKAFGGPYELKQRLGHLDAGRIAAMDPDQLEQVFRQRPALLVQGGARQVGRRVVGVLPQMLRQVGEGFVRPALPLAGPGPCAAVRNPSAVVL